MTPGGVAGRSWQELLRLVRGSAFIFFCRVTGAALTLLTQVLLARWMGAAELGIYVLALSWALLLANVSTLGFPAAAVRFVGVGLARQEPGYARAFVGHAVRVIIGASLTLAAAGIALLWSVADSDAKYRVPMMIALAVVPPLAMLQFIGGAATGYSRFALGFLPNNVFRTSLVCCLVVLAWEWGVVLESRLAMGLQAAAIVIVLVPTLLRFRAMTTAQTGARVAAHEPRLWTRTALSLLVAMLFTGYFPEFVIILAGAYLPSHELAVLHVGFRVAMLVSFGLYAIDAFTGPDLARLHALGERTALERIVNRATRLRFWLSLAAVVAFLVLGRSILGVFGAEFVDGYELLLILASGMLVQGAVGPVIRLMGVTGHQDRSLMVFAVALAFAAVLIVLFVPRFGATGAAVAASASLALSALWMRQLTVRHLGVHPRIW